MHDDNSLLTDKDMDLALCELQHRIDTLLRDNDDMRLELWAKDRALVVMAERINELESSSDVA